MARLDAEATRRYNAEYRRKNAERLREQAKKRWAEWYKKNRARHIANNTGRGKKGKKESVIVEKKYDASALIDALQGLRKRPGTPQAVLPRQQGKVCGEM